MLRFCCPENLPQSHSIPTRFLIIVHLLRWFIVYPPALLKIIFIFGSMPSGHFVHDPLPSPTSIRLIQLLLPENDSLRISLFSTELENAPHFDALSYTWDDPLSPYVNTSLLNPHVDYNSPSIRILCNSMTMFIRKNLYDALQKLQTGSFDSVGKTRQSYVWIDAICIYSDRS